MSLAASATTRSCPDPGRRTKTRCRPTATGWPYPGETFANGSTIADFTLSGTVEDFTSIDATYSGGNSSGTLTLTYDLSVAALGASDNVVNGAYTNTNGSTLTVTDGDLSYVSGPDPGCTGSGTIEFEDAGLNVYDWDITLSSCTAGDGVASGVAMIADSSGGSNNTLFMIGQINDVPWVMQATK